MTDDPLPAISAYIAREILKQPNRAIDPTTRLLSSGLVDSLSIVDLATFIEDRFGVRLKVTELNAQTFDTLAELAGLVEARRNGKAGS